MDDMKIISLAGTISQRNSGEQQSACSRDLTQGFALTETFPFRFHDLQGSSLSGRKASDREKC
jgi:hypothetical protein